MAKMLTEQECPSRTRRLRLYAGALEAENRKLSRALYDIASLITETSRELLGEKSEQEASDG